MSALGTTGYLGLLIRWRWIALPGLLACTLAADGLTELVVDWRLFLGCLAVGLVSNGAAAWGGGRLAEQAQRHLARGLLILDSVLLAFFLGSSGGAHNPLSSLYLLLVVMAAILFGRGTAVGVAMIASVSFAYLYFGLPQLCHETVGISHDLHIQGMVVVLGGMSLVIVLFVDGLKRAAEIARAQLEEKERFEALGTLAAGVAHELATPLGTIAVAARELEKTARQSCPGAACQDDARLIREQVDRCRSILDRLNAHSLQDLKNPGEVIDLAQIEPSLRAGLSAAEARDLQLQIEAAPARIKAPRALLLQSLANLVRNAAQANPDGRPITVAVRRQSRQVVVEIADRGTGMAAGHLQQAGQPFFTTRRHGEGLGMGIFIARSLTERLGGSLKIRSAPGQGTTVTLQLPEFTGTLPAEPAGP